MGVTGLVPCPGCGALVPDAAGPTHACIGASAGCWAAWGELQARSFASPAIASVQPLAVDVYAVQHPGLAERRAIQSVWVHLVSLCLTAVADVVRRWAEVTWQAWRVHHDAVRVRAAPLTWD